VNALLAQIQLTSPALLASATGVGNPFFKDVFFSDDQNTSETHFSHLLKNQTFYNPFFV
jgi:hypothetical protein